VILLHGAVYIQNAQKMSGTEEENQGGKTLCQ